MASTQPAQRSNPGVRRQILREGTQQTAAFVVCTTQALHLKKHKTQILQPFVLGLYQHILVIFQKQLT